MGHHLFINDRARLAMRDFEVVLVRHFLVEGARQLGNEALVNAIADWEYQGPGVWVGIDEAVLTGRESLFAKAVEVAEEFGDEISVGYLNREVELPGARWLEPQATEDVVALIRRLQDHCA